ncbi:MAG TPA: hypothetical protein VFT95_19400 [Micromonosporaceae bacterium]|nr:hypothetical protein [Micromonosporaceae bacterium]
MVHDRRPEDARPPAGAGDHARAHREPSGWVLAADDAVTEAAVLTGRVAAGGELDPTHRLELLHDALSSIRTAAQAIRFAVVAEGDRQRASRRTANATEGGKR